MIKQNIIAGPKQGDYWNHSQGLETPEYREEGPFPVQGNIGSLLIQESTNYNSCSTKDPISGGPNCTGVFNGDIYSRTNTCGDNCKLQAPESFGMQDFGMTSDKTTNIHGLHAYENIRAGSEGKGPASVYGCYEFVPNMKKSFDNTCQIDYSTFENNTVGNWTVLPSEITNPRKAA
jgi:hypothetical protein